jgi:hypothetical protein
LTRFDPRIRRASLALGLVAALFSAPRACADAAPFGVPVRLSVKFFLNASGNRPATGDINTDEEVRAQVARGNQILATWTHELRLHLVEIVDLSGLSQWYLATTDDRDAIRSAAIADPTAYAWRNNAVNIYITGNSGCSARADFPPNNNIVVVCQSIFDTTIMHEIGHILHLYHTHETAGSDGGDECSDTIKDNDSWSRDQISYTNFSLPYASLSAAQKYQVDLVWSNVMSYHNGDYRWMLSNCQRDRMSQQASDDQNWLLTKRPVYVDPGRYVPLFEFGTYLLPYQNIQKAINAGALNNRVLVLQAGTHDNPTSRLSTSTDVVPREGAAIIRDFKPDYDLPSNLEESPNPKLRDAILRVQLADRQRDHAAAIKFLLEAEQYAAARERDAVRLELAQRYRDRGELEQAEAWLLKLAAESDQPGLRARCRNKANDARAEIQRRIQQKSNPPVQGQSDDSPSERGNP